jgi:HSP20 family protein
MARTYLPSLFGSEDESLGSLLQTFEDFSRRFPFPPSTRFASEVKAPRIDISESKDALEIMAELPGIDEKDVEVTLSEGMLTIRGQKKSERDEKDTDKHWHVIERTYGAFSRSVALPFEPDSGKVEAKFDKGVLRIRLPKPPEVAKKQQKIEIKKA